MSRVHAPFTIEPRRGVRLKGKAVRDGQLWTLTLDAFPDHTETGYDLVKAQKRLAEKVARLLGPRRAGA